MSESEKSPVRILGISAKKLGGKTTAFRAIEKTASGTVWNVMFAEQLKKIVLDCFVPFEWGWALEDLDEDSNKSKETPCGKSVRELLQIIGTDMFRDGLWQDVWVNAASSKAKRILRSDVRAIVVFSDVRFPNEVTAIQALGGKVIRLLRAPFAGQDQHASETALDGKERLFDFVVDNREMSIEEQGQHIHELLLKMGVK